MSYEDKIIFIFTNINGIYGRGHYSRMNILAEKLELSGFNVFFISENENDDILLLAKERGHQTLLIKEAFKKTAAAVVVDKRETDSFLIRRLKDIAPVIVIDSIGNERNDADIVIEMLPTKETKSEKDIVNIKPYSFTILKTSKNKNLEKSREVLVYVGDNRDLFDFLTSVLQNIKTHTFIVVANFPFDEVDYNRNTFDNIFVSKMKENLFDKLYSAFITYFGLSSFEALGLGIPTALISPTEYHNELAKENVSMFYNLGFYKHADKRKMTDDIKYFLRSEYVKNDLLKNAKNIDTEFSLNNFVRLFENIGKIKNVSCDVCGQGIKDISFRANIGNLYRCKKCKTIQQRYFIPADAEYNKSYFTDEYKAQYGVSYEEDKALLCLMARDRLSVLKKIKGKGTLLELGSAMGFFVREALDFGYDAEGIEISSYAASYARSHLGVNVKCASVDDFEYKKKGYDVICAWYVLEHLPNLISFLDTIYLSLKDNGVLAFSMPNCRGLTGRFKKNYYHSIVPKDHAYEFSPKSINKLLRKKGFVKYKIVIKGIHFKRFISLLPKCFYFLENIGFINFLYKHFASFAGWGDTFEAYYIKK